MRIMVMFDLPVETSTQRKDYRLFRKFLIKSGFLMMQESIYCKLALNQTVADGIMQEVRKQAPPSGLVQMLVVTEKQFSKMENVVGKSESDVLDSDKRVIFL